MINRNVIEFWVMWNSLKKKNIKWNSLIKIINESSSFASGVEDIKSSYFSQIDIFGNSSHNIDESVDAYISKLQSMNISVISKDDFPKYKSLKRIKGSHWFFIKGDTSLLDHEINDFVSVVGSRTTPDTYEKWLDDINTNKIIISGLANGADLIGHKWAIKHRLPIVVFPGKDITRPPKKGDKKSVWDYAVNNGIIISDILPGTDAFDKSMFLKRNKWMAQMSIISYILYFKGQSGTLGQALESAKIGNEICMPKNIFMDNINFLESYSNFKPIINSIKVMGDMDGK